MNLASRLLPFSPWRPFRSARTRAVAAVVAACGYTVVAPAQSALEDEFTVQRFDPAPGPRNFITTRGVRTDGRMAWSGGLVLNYAHQPFVVRSCSSETNCDDPNASQDDIKVVENLLTADALASLTPIPRLQVSVKIPVTWVDGQGLTEEGTGDLPDGLSAVGLGDVQLEGKYRLHGEVNDPYVFGAGAFVTAPFGTLTSEGNYIGDPTPTTGLRGIFDGVQGPFSFGANLAGVFRGSGRVGTTELGPFEFRYGVAGAYSTGAILRVVVDAFGTTKFSSKNGTNSLELDAGAQITPYGSPLVFTAGVGTGIIEGVGMPIVRAFAGVLYVAESSDRDGDGYQDDADSCPTIAEDRDGKEDEDGCPDLDNDGDELDDSADKCPKQAEDPDGFEDIDGCPELDNDKDGVGDDQDACPEKPETKNGFKDDDGCPDEPDTDKDGVADAKDQCKAEAEDTDGFQDTDGCPDPDNDNDGVQDNKDECVDEPETTNGVEDEDGCPEATAAPPAAGGAKPATPAKPGAKPPSGAAPPAPRPQP
jgi:hypothetical protein